MGAGDIVNFGTTAWNIIEDNQASADISTAVGSALPHIDDWDNLSAPAGTNKMGRQIIYFHTDGSDAARAFWTLHWEYGVKYKGGGAYIQRAWMTVDALDIDWGWNISVSLAFDQPSNATGDPKRPVARLPMRITKRVWSKFNITNETEPFDWVIYGDGKIETNGH